MPQEHYVLCCFSCKTFQVHIVKKAKKWECKMCGAKQSLKRSYGKGTGKDCRAHVMKLNELRMLKDNNFDEMEGESFDETSTNVVESKLEEQETSEKKPLTSKWSDYLETPCQEDEEEENENTEEDIEHIFHKDTKRTKRKSQNISMNCSKGKRFKSDSTVPDVPYVTSSVEEVINPSTTDFIQEILESDKKTHRSNNTITSNFKTTDKIKQSKYFKYLTEDDSENGSELPLNTNKKSNIFNTDSNNLDDILNF